jgi:hypothetical protein
MHPLILAIRQRDKALRDQGKQPGLWAPEEVVTLFGTGKSNVYEMAKSGRVECTNLCVRGTTNKQRRITSNGLIAFIEANTSGPDEALTLGNLQATIRTLSLEALMELKAYTEQRIKIVSQGGPLMPRQRRTLAAALAETPHDARQMDLFASPTPTPTPTPTDTDTATATAIPTAPTHEAHA